MTPNDLIPPVAISVGVEIVKRFGLPDGLVKPLVLGAAFVASLVPLFTGHADLGGLVGLVVVNSAGAVAVYEWALKHVGRWLDDATAEIPLEPRG